MADEKREKKKSTRRLSLHEVQKILGEFGSRGVTVDNEFFIVPVKRGMVHVHKWTGIPWSVDGGKTVDEYIDVGDRIRRILVGE